MDSVSEWIVRMEDGDDEAARHLWERYFAKLIRVAERRLSGAAKKAVDAEDVAVSVFESVFDGMRQGRFDRMQDRDDLWRLLVKITRFKAVDEIRRENAARRGGGQVQGASVFGDPANPDHAAGDDPRPEDVVELEERLTQCLDNLEDPVVRQVAELRLAGWKNPEIAEQLAIPKSSVVLKLKIIRRRWEALHAADRDAEGAGGS